MRQSKRNRKPWVLPFLVVSALSLMFCEPGKTLEPVVNDPGGGGSDTGKIASIRVLSAPTQLQPSDSGLVRVSIRDSADSLPITGARLSVSSSQFSILSASGSGAFNLDSVPESGTVNFVIHSTTPGTGTVTVRVISGNKVRSASFQVIVTERPVAPLVVETFPSSMGLVDTARLSLVVVDSAQEKPLENAVVTISSPSLAIRRATAVDTFSVDTTGADGKISFRATAAIAGPATIQVRVRTAAGITRNVTYTLTVNEVSGNERPRKMIFTAVRSTLRADGSDSTELKVLVKDDNNNPLAGEKIRFTASGGLVKASATTDDWGQASTFLVSERANRSVVVTATLEKTGATSQQVVAFDGVTILISTDKKVLMQGTSNNVLFDLKDGGNVPMSGDSLELTILGAAKGFSGNNLGSAPETLIVVTDTRGQYRGNFTRNSDGLVIVTARALGARAVDTTKFTSDNLSMTTDKGSILGNGSETAVITARLLDGNGNARPDVEMRWTTTFGTFTAKPFSSTGGDGRASITLRAPNGSGLAIVNVEAWSKSGGSVNNLLASGNIVVPVKALKVHRLELRLTPDNIPVKIGETKLMAKAYDSADNVMTGVLVGFRLVKGAGGGDEVISPPIDYTKSGTAEAMLKAGGVISFYRGVKVSAVALDISGGDTLVIAASDTVGLTISGPPHRVSVGVNIEKGLNPEDGTFGLPTAAVVTDVNGNLVADGTPVNFSTTPIGLAYYGISWHYTNTWPYYFIGDTVRYELPWSDYNDNRKLDPGEPPSPFSRTVPSRGEDRDGNGFVNLPPETFNDLNGNGVWDSVNAEPFINAPPTDTSGRAIWVDFNKDGIRDVFEPFEDSNGDLRCQCAGTLDAAGNLYETQYYGNETTHPFPGEVSVGITKQVQTLGGKATTAVIYVQSDAQKVRVRITAEANGIRSAVDDILPIVKSDE